MLVWIMSGVHVLQVHALVVSRGCQELGGTKNAARVDAHAAHAARTRARKSTRKSTHAATPFVLVVPCAAASRRVAASRLPRGECSVVRGARWVAHDVSWKWKWYLVIFLVLNRGEEMWAGRCRCGPRERGTALAVLYIEWHLTWMREWMRGLVRAPSSWSSSCTLNGTSRG